MIQKLPLLFTSYLTLYRLLVDEIAQHAIPSVRTMVGRLAYMLFRPVYSYIGYHLDTYPINSSNSP